ncbi:MAG: AmmeMemoRadiSam system radical SAM enzyme [Deltaproteobacteria bacterium]|jgi:pyruvate formate lyase activating enzyme|nr:AmmeMemoRadiSam system radical SAM enzyme [Deltaproteobacteria bacterium]
MKKISRRRFLGGGAACMMSAVAGQAWWPLADDTCEAAVTGDIRGRVFKGDGPEKLWQWSREGFVYTKLEGRKVICEVCPNLCLLSPGDRSVCRSRVNMDGKLYSLAYGNPCSINTDPIEKKPLFHFRPRIKAFSLATTGCNFRCLNCQNWEISQAKPHEVPYTYTLFPEEVIAAARKSQAESIAYTYSEPVTFFEYMIDTARLARQAGIYNLWVSNGYINAKPLLALCEVLDGASINLKAFSDDIYRGLNGGRLQPVLDTFKTLHAHHIHFEMINLVVPGYTDDDEMVKKMCAWILDNIGPDHPLHFLRFFPRYKLNRLPPTPVSTLSRYRQMAMQMGVRYVYVGNVARHEGNHTYCHNCKKLLIERQGYVIPTYNLAGGRCKFCDTVIPGVWEGAGAPSAPGHSS